jgi:hypothetical protein
MRVSWGTGIALAYALFAAATTGFVVFAMQRPVDLVSPDYYARSLREDERLVAIANVSRLGAAFNVTAERDAVTVTIPIGLGPPEGSITLYRASNAQDDRVIPLRTTSAGQQRISLSQLPRGQWTLQVEWTGDGRSFYYEQPVTVP